MRYAIIDIGSNTIRLIIFEKVDKNIETLFSKKTVAGLSSYIENSKMTEKGINKLIRILKSYKKISDLMGVKAFLPFATASLRLIDNQKEVLDSVKKEIGVDIDLIEGKREAELGYRSLLDHNGTKDGVLIDIGGGSTEIIIFEDKKVIETHSFSMGCLNSFTKLTKGLLPEKKERDNIRETFNKIILKEDLSKGIYPRIYGIGGTVRAVGNIGQEYLNLDSNQNIKRKDIEKIAKNLFKEDNKIIRQVLQIVPERIHTITPGILILKAIMDRFDAEELQIIRKGIREGYLSEYLEKEG